MRLPISPSASLMLIAPLALIGSVASNQVAIATSEPAHTHDSDYEHFYIGVDGFDLLQSGDYAGLDNPNSDRLTFLYSHVEEDPTTNHFHGIGSYSYSGAVDSPTINSTNINNRIPETYTGLPPITLQLGTGIYADKLVSTSTEEEYSNLTIEAVSSLQSNEDIGAHYLFNSSNGRWSESLANAMPALELVSITDGLNIADEQGLNILTQVGETYTMGSGDDISFTPTFWTDTSASAGTYSASFRLLNLSNANESSFRDSGTFNLDFQVTPVPEPSAFLGVGAFALLALFRKNRLKKAVKF
ncbi:all3515 family Zur-repressed PEP-CTERM protein [Chlorogloea sp. CCALA 695]|uniref:all3515 family Zur-repressed PEP-CTERM protein n=1 Tax=Chlorogloea sp. CCALA 695 TaxID=2107693 RepID=UPI000D054039|nr:all3515 family Zur-repressed PEP-CTERM protein [Chlorogloea sp. CCALA 695]PSB27381.1 PEP-CTERM sorting domain-containing protein [Chlorogloea sp. CCALA 695]